MEMNGDVTNGYIRKLSSDLANNDNKDSVLVTNGNATKGSVTNTFHQICQGKRIYNIIRASFGHYFLISYLLFGQSPLMLILSVL